MSGRALSQQARQNMERNARILEYHLAGRRSVAMATLKEDAQHYHGCIEREQRDDKEVILAAIQSENPLDFHDYISDHNWDVEGSPPFIPRSLQENREVMLALVGLKDFSIEDYEIPQPLLSDKEVMIAVCSKTPSALEYASETLRDDIDVVLAAITQEKNGPPSLAFASDRLKDNKDVILALFQRPEWDDSVAQAFCDVVDADSHLRDDPQVAIALISSGKPSWEYRDILCEFSQQIRGNREVIEKAVSVEGFMLEDASDELKADKEIVLMACGNEGRALQFASSDLRADMEVINTACQNHGEALSFIDDWDVYDTCATDPEFMRTVVCSKGGSQIFVAPRELQEDEDLVLEAIRNGCHMINIPLVSMKSRPDFIVKALAIEPELFNELRRTQKRNKDIIRAALLGGYSTCADAQCMEEIWRRFPNVFLEPDIFLWMAEHGEREYYRGWDLPDTLRGDKEFMLKACACDGTLLEYAFVELREDTDVIQAAIRQNQGAITAVQSSYLEQNPEIVLEYLSHTDSPVELSSEILRADRRIALAYASQRGSLEDDLEEFDDDPEIVRAVVARDPEELEAADAMLRDDRQFLLTVVRQTGLALEHIPDELQADFELRLAAIANEGKVADLLVQECGEQALWKLAKTIRAKLELYDNYVSEILCAMDSREQTEDSETQIAPIGRGGAYQAAEASLASLLSLTMETPLMGMFFGGFGGLRFLQRQITPPPPPPPPPPPSRPQCSLPLLNMGDETSIALKRLIADFIGVPRGVELGELKQASDNLARRGY